MTRFALAFAVCLAGCIRSDQIACDDGTLCPHDMVCDGAHGGCVTPAQLSVCDAGQAFGTACQAGAVTGACYDGVCLPTGCGNHVVEPALSEQCDPPAPGNGCSADCKSNEACGNGIVDAITAEDCDDGSRLSHDGCDSLCRNETLQFSYVAYGPAVVQPSSGILDEAHGTFLQVDGYGTTWGWDGAKWSLLRAGLMNPVALTYDVDRARAVALAVDPQMVGMVTQLVLDPWEWDGTTWTQRVLPNAPVTGGGGQLYAAYDVVGHTALVVSGGTTYKLDLTGGGWTATTAAAVPMTFQAMVHDRARGVSMLVAGNGTVLEWSGTAWVARGVKLPQVGTPPADLTSINLVYDSDRAHVVVWGGCNTATAVPACTNQAYEWNGATATWTAFGTTAPMPPSAYAEVAFDVTAHQTLLITGRIGSVPRGQMWIHDGNGWARHGTPGPTVDPFDIGGVTAFARGTAVFAQSWSSTWIRSGPDAGWTQVPSAGPDLVVAMAYDPIRDQVIAAHSLGYVNGFETNEFVALDPVTGWQPMATPAPDGGFVAMTYDPVNKRLVAATSDATYGLDSSIPDSPTSAWSVIADPPPVSGIGIASTVQQLLFDASCDCLVFVQQNRGQIGVRNTSVTVLQGTTWGVGISPSSPYVGAEWSARGDVMLVPWGDEADVYEHRSSTTSTAAPTQYPFDGMVYDDPMLGGPVGVGVVQGFIGEYAIGYRSADGDDRCDGGDGDGDGLVDCADPDCWWKCKPACPPGVCP